MDLSTFIMSVFCLIDDRLPEDFLGPPGRLAEFGWLHWHYCTTSKLKGGVLSHTERLTRSIKLDSRLRRSSGPRHDDRPRRNSSLFDHCVPLLEHPLWQALPGTTVP
jgi:hypothetical protein